MSFLTVSLFMMYFKNWQEHYRNKSQWHVS